MAKPIIGVTPLWDKEKQSLWMLPGYLAGIFHAGGVPVVLPFTKDEQNVKRLAQSCDGFLFTGGQDIAPALYGEEPIKQLDEVSSERDTLEPLLFREAVQGLKKPAFGICRGHQLFNVLLGGSLVQDIYTQSRPQLRHRQESPYEKPHHDVTVAPGTLLQRLTGKQSLAVNSLHHQVVKELAPGLQSMATSPEGYVEALHYPEHPCLFSVQWHPEYCVGERDSDVLFRYFIDACKN